MISPYDNLSFCPFNMEMLDAICEEFKRDSILYKYFTDNKWDDMAVSWGGMFLHQIYHYFKSVDWTDFDEALNSVFYSYLESQTMQLEWIVFSMMYGQYGLVMRELRNIVESAFLFYKMDTCEKYRKKSGAYKFCIIDSLLAKKAFVKIEKAFENSGYEDWKRVYSCIYQPLSKYVHTNVSVERNKKAYPDFNGMPKLSFDRKEAQNCMYYLQQVLILESKMMISILDKTYNITDTSSIEDIFDANIVPRA